MNEVNVTNVTNEVNVTNESGGSGWTVDKVRNTFLRFFRDHTIVASSSVRPDNDPTLLFCNAGMNQFKPIFLGNAPFPECPRVCNSQKCIRAGGKHNDLDDVGKDTYHHTFFEMLGNWSFNDYWKQDAIRFAWLLLTEVYHLDPNKIYVTYFAGSTVVGDAGTGNPGSSSIPEDTETRDIWKQYLPESRILPFGMKENFWEMGDSGPCGACTEIHYDRGNGGNGSGLVRDASSLVNKDDPDVLEIWNLVFTEFNRLPPKESQQTVDSQPQYVLAKLPHRFVDTGMGLERLVSILQGVHSNYDTDVFRALIDRLYQLARWKPYTGKTYENDVNGVDTAYRIIVDHIRTICVCLADDVVPGHQMRENVLRQIIRRAIRAGRSKFRFKQPFLCEMVDTVADTLGAYYQNISEHREKIKWILHQEEVQYMKTLESAYKSLARVIKEYEKGNKGMKLSADDTFNLWHTHGLPREVIEEELTSLGFSGDFSKF